MKKNTKKPADKITLEMVKKFIKLWETNTLKSLGAELGINKERVLYIARTMRRMGYKLPKKHHKGYLKQLIIKAYEK